MQLWEMAREDILNGDEVAARLDDIEAEENLDDELVAERDALRSIVAAVEGYGGDRIKDTTFIRDSYFKTYAQQYAEDIGAIDSEAGWPSYAIDWDRAAGDLQMDYTSVEIDGVDFWFR